MIKLGKYKHYKGKEYEVLYLAKNANNGVKKLEDMVVYQQLGDYGEFPKGFLWVRSLSEFSENVEVNGEKVLRFKYTEDDK